MEVAVLELYDEAGARSTSPGFDDVLGTPFLEDTDDDQVGERVRPGTQVEVKARVEVTRHDEQDQDQTGNAPRSFLKLIVNEDHLRDLSLLADGVPSIRVNDRLLKLKSNTSGALRVDFVNAGRQGLFCFQVQPGDTGERKWILHFEARRPVAQ